MAHQQLGKVKIDSRDRHYFPDLARPFCNSDAIKMRIYGEGYGAFCDAWKAFRLTGIVCIPINPYPSGTLQWEIWEDGFYEADRDADVGLIQLKAT